VVWFVFGAHGLVAGHLLRVLVRHRNRIALVEEPELQCP